MVFLWIKWKSVSVYNCMMIAIITNVQIFIWKTKWMNTDRLSVIFFSLRTKISMVNHKFGKAKSTELGLYESNLMSNHVNLLDSRFPNHKVILHDSLICIYIIICVIIHSPRTLSSIVNTKTICYAFPKPFIFNQMPFVCFTSQNLFGWYIYWIESIDLNGIKWTQMFEINHWKRTYAHPRNWQIKQWKWEKRAHKLTHTQLAYISTLYTS